MAPIQLVAGKIKKRTEHPDQTAHLHTFDLGMSGLLKPKDKSSSYIHKCTCGSRVLTGGV